MKIEGLSAYKKRLKEMPKNVNNNINKLHEKTLEVGYKSAREGVPVDTGELRDSITKDENSLYATAGHAETVEYGNANQPASLYMTKAREDMKKHLKENIGGVLDGK